MADFIFHNKRLARKALRGGLVITICWLWPGEDIDSVSAADNDKNVVSSSGCRPVDRFPSSRFHKFRTQRPAYSSCSTVTAQDTQFVMRGHQYRSTPRFQWRFYSFSTTYILYCDSLIITMVVLFLYLIILLIV